MILVTGGAGFIGSHLVDRLLERGDAVVCIDDFNDFYAPSEKRANVAGQLRRPGYRLVEADIRTREQMIALAVALQPTAIIHLAARAGVRPSVRAPELYAQTNILGTLNLLEAARAASVPRVVFGSSSSVYGLNSTAPFREDHPLLCPASPYAATKIAGEALCAILARTLPEPWRVEALVLLAFSAYVRGDGPLAGLSLEAALRCDPDHRMAGMLDTALQSGMRPERIRELAGTGYRLAKRLGVSLPPRRAFGRAG